LKNLLDKGILRHLEVFLKITKISFMKLAPKTFPLSEILPNPPILLMGAGPVPVSEEVKKASSIVFSHMGPTMAVIIKNLQTMAQYVFQTSTSRIVAVAGPASASMEMAMTSLVWPGRKVLVINLGTFSQRFKDLSEGMGGIVTEIKPEGINCVYESQVKAVLEKESFDVLTIVHGETSCGIQNKELAKITKLAKSYGLQVVVDAVVTLSCAPVYMDEWDVDIMFTGGQKGVSAIPGISLIAFSESVFEFIQSRKVIMPHWCLDVRRAWKFWGMGEYHYTAPVPGILALYEGLRLICEETLEKRFLRHEESSLYLQKEIEKMGLSFYAPEACRLNSVVAIRTPEGYAVKDLIAHMIKCSGVEISGAFGLNIFRIGQMGEQCRRENVKRTLSALKLAMSELKLKIA
jgi:alanine-glyoxylate transaminase / serine-glyoxylate transaminase / serine-pyruvate transaminase